MKLKRDLVKYVRDKAKSQYKKILNVISVVVTENLDFHHFFGLTEFLDIWLKKEGKKIETEDEILIYGSIHRRA